MLRNETKKSRAKSQLSSPDFAGFVRLSGEFARMPPKQYGFQHIFHSIGVEEVYVMNVALNLRWWVIKQGA